MRHRSDIWWMTFTESGNLIVLHSFISISEKFYQCEQCGHRLASCLIASRLWSLAMVWRSTDVRCVRRGSIFRVSNWSFALVVGRDEESLIMKFHQTWVIFRLRAMALKFYLLTSISAGTNRVWTPKLDLKSTFNCIEHHFIGCGLVVSLLVCGGLVSVIHLWGGQGCCIMGAC